MLTSVYIAESVDADDFYKHRQDGHAANEILKILDVPTEYRVTITKKLLKKAVKEAAAGAFEVFHFSSHGNDESVGLTDGTSISWDKFAKILEPFSGKNKALVMATCGGGDEKLTHALTKSKIVFGWVFGSTADTVSFSDSCLAWSILYNRLFDHGFSKKSLQRTLLAINGAIDGDFVYRRWDGKRYMKFPRSVA